MRVPEAPVVVAGRLVVDEIETQSAGQVAEGVVVVEQEILGAAALEEARTRLGGVGGKPARAPRRPASSPGAPSSMDAST